MDEGDAVDGYFDIILTEERGKDILNFANVGKVDKKESNHVDIVRIQDVGLSGADDPTVLEWTAEEGRVLLTHDVKTITKYAYDCIHRLVMLQIYLYRFFFESNKSRRLKYAGHYYGAGPKSNHCCS